MTEKVSAASRYVVVRDDPAHVGVVDASRPLRRSQTLRFARRLVEEEGMPEGQLYVRVRAAGGSQSDFTDYRQFEDEPELYP